MTGRISWRPATPQDVPLIRQISREAYAKWIEVIGREPLPMTADYESTIHIHRFELLERSGGAIGVLETIDRPDHLWIENIAVSPACQGKGHGGLLMARAEQTALQLGHRAIRLATNGAFRSNIDFYRRHRFVLDEEKPFRGGVMVLMSKRLEN